MSYKKLLSICILVCTCIHFSYGQHESNNWYFGVHAGITFNNGTPVALSNGALSTHEGVASISDSAGNLLFYTDGVVVYDAVHAVMPNGTGLKGDPSSTQSGIIVKKPMSNTLYYIFTMADVTSSAGLRYSIVDMSLNGGLGEVTTKNVLVFSSARERLTSVKHANGIDYWVLMVSYSSDEIRAYRLDSSGLDTAAVVSYAGSIRQGVYSYSLGYMKANRQNNKLAIGTWTRNDFIVVDFDNSTGIADSIGRHDIQCASYAYGVEFSPDGNLLYCSTLSGTNHIFQFDLTLGNDSLIYANRYDVTSDLNGSCSAFRYGALQLGPDGRIYGVNVCDSSLFAINNPDQPGAACGFVSQAVLLGSGTCDLGLPNLVSHDVFPPAAVNDIEKDDLFVAYPNPATDMLHVKSKFIIISIRIYDAVGRNVYTEKNNSKVSHVNIKDIQSGIYFLHVETKTGTALQRFVVAD